MHAVGSGLAVIHSRSTGRFTGTQAKSLSTCRHCFQRHDKRLNRDHPQSIGQRVWRCPKRLLHWRYLPDALAISWMLLFVFLYLSPALKDGSAFGPSDLGRGVSLLTRLPNPLPTHNPVNGDIITQSLPWNTLDWRLVHSGQLPLWNSYSGTGLPQLLN